MLTLWLCFTLTKSYYLSPNVFTLEQGRQFCQNQCKSDLSSIHDIYEFQQAITSISDSQLIFNNTAHILIGLYSAQSSNTFQWYDDTSFDFGSNLNGSYPWDTSNPSRPNTAQRCVVLNAQNSYRWNDIDCDVKYPVLCDHCDAILNKYIIAVNPSALWEDAKSECVSIGSTLASMHSGRDFEEMRTLCAISDNGYCYIGLYEPDRDGDWTNAINLDNTSFDFGSTLGQYPWDSGQPETNSGEYTVWLEMRNDYLLHDVGLSITRNKIEALCNMPSALCDIQDNGWTDMSVIHDACELLSISDGYQSAVWTQYQWYNGNGILRMDVNMKMNFNANALYPETGFHLESCSGSTYFFMIYRGDTEDALCIGYNDYVFENVSLPFNIDGDIYYALSVNIVIIEEDALLFNVSFLDVQYISHYQRLSDIPLQNGQDKAWQINRNGTRSYIGVYTKDTSTHFKSVYVSGTRIQTVPLELCATTTTDAATAVSTTAPKGVNDTIAMYGMTITVQFVDVLDAEVIAEVIHKLEQYVVSISSTTDCTETVDIETQELQDNSSTIYAVITSCNAQAEEKLVAEYDGNTLETSIISIQHLEVDAILSIKAEAMNDSEGQVEDEEDDETTGDDDEADETVNTLKEMMDAYMTYGIIGAVCGCIVALLVVMRVVKRRKKAKETMANMVDTNTKDEDVESENMEEREPGQGKRISTTEDMYTEQHAVVVTTKGDMTKGNQVETIQVDKDDKEMEAMYIKHNVESTTKGYETSGNIRKM